MKISEILRKAADRHLSSDGKDDFQRRIDFYSYVAVIYASGALDARPAEHFLQTLGVSLDSPSEFDEFPEGEIRQGARFLWLDFAALVAEDEGL